MSRADQETTLPTKAAFEQRYSDDSGVEFAVRLDALESDMSGGYGVVEFERIQKVQFPLDKLDWLIACLAAIRKLRTDGWAT